MIIMISVVLSMVISSLYFVEHLCQSWILPLTVRFYPSPCLWLGLAFVPLTLSLEPFLPIRSRTTCLILPLALSMISHIIFFPWWTIRRSLLPEDLLDLTDLFLHFAGNLFDFAFGLQLGIISDFPGRLPDLTLCFVKRAFHFVIRAGFHDISPL